MVPKSFYHTRESKCWAIKIHETLVIHYISVHALCVVFVLRALYASRNLEQNKFSGILIEVLKVKSCLTFV